MARLFETALEFARAQPALASLLGTSSSDDPAIERVREGIFFLGATIIEQVRRFEADGHRSLADIVAPDVSRPFPAASIVELTAPEGGLARVPTGSELHVRGDPRRRFRIVSGIDVGPTLIQGCRVEQEQRRSLRFDLTARGAPLARSVGASLRVYIDEPHEIALGLLHHLLSHTVRVELRRGSGETVAIRAIEPFGFAAHHALAPEPDGIDTGASLVREYFLLPEKFLLFDVRGVAEALGDAPDAQATLIFRFDAPLPQSVRLSPSSLRPHCTPVVNLFATTAEPRLCTPAATSYPLRVAGLLPEEASVYAVLGVHATNPGAGTPPVRVPPARRFGAAPVVDAFPYFYSTKLQPARDATEPDTALLLASPAKRPPVIDPHVLSVSLLATNRRLGANVKPGDLSEPGVRMPPSVTARNIVPTSSYVPACSVPGFVLRSIVRGQVAREDPLYTLKAILYSLVPHQAFEADAARALVARVDAIEGLEVQNDRNMERTRRGYLARLTLDETPFSGAGDVALFLRVLHHVLDARASVNRFYRCEVQCTKSGERWRWPAGRSA